MMEILRTSIFMHVIQKRRAHKMAPRPVSNGSYSMARGQPGSQSPGTFMADLAEDGRTTQSYESSAPPRGNTCGLVPKNRS